MKKIISIMLTAALALSMFCVSFTSNAAVSITFHSNNTLASEQSFTKSSSEVNGMYDIPDVGNRFVFKGWYYGADDDAQAVDFANDSFTQNTDVYAHWADIGVVSADAQDNSGTGYYDGFDLVGVQLRAGEFNSSNGGLRFIGTLSNSLLEELDALSELTVQGEYTNRVEYGFVAASEYSINSWKTFAESQGIDMSGYQLGYSGTNVNGADTTAHNRNYQVAKNIDCTASDYSDSTVSDYHKYSDYRLYSLAITYENAGNYVSSAVAVRAYIRYCDANGLLRTFYNDYDGTNTCGGLSASYDSVNTQTAEPGYYSTFAAVLSDVNNMTTNNADSNISEAVCSMYISGGTAYIKLLKDTSLSGVSTFYKNADLNLNGKTLSVGSYRVNSTAEFSMYNGTYTTGTSVEIVSLFTGDLTKLSDVSFNALNLDMNNTFNGVVVTGQSAYFTDCNFNISANESAYNCNGNFFYGAKHAAISGCTYNIDSKTNKTYGIFSSDNPSQTENKSIMSLSVDNSAVTIEQTSESISKEVYAICSFNAGSHKVSDSAVNISGDYKYAYAVLATNSSANDGKGVFCADNIDINMNIDDVPENSGLVFGIYLGKGQEAQIKNNVDIDIVAKSPMYSTLCGIRGEGNAKAVLNGVNIDVNATETDSENGRGTVKGYRLYGVETLENTDFTVLKARIKVPISFTSSPEGDHNSGIAIFDNTLVTISPEKDEDVYIQGGYAALASIIPKSATQTGKYIISGGNYCSQSHGVYLAGDADITGGRFYNIIDGPYNPSSNGAFYATHSAQINITDAVIEGGQKGLKTKNGTDELKVTISGSKTVIRGLPWGVVCESGTVEINSGVIIHAEIEKVPSGGAIIDNR